MTVESNQKKIERRFRVARPWLFLMLLVAVATFIVGQYWVFADSDCPPLQTLLLGVFTGLAWIVMSVLAIFARNNSPLSQLTRVAGVFVLGLTFSALAGMAMYQVPDLRSQICPTCEKFIENSEDLRKTAEKDANPLIKLNSAEFYGRRAVSTCGTNMKPRAADVLAHILFDQAGSHIKNGDCERAKLGLSEAISLTTKYNLDINFVKAIEERETNRKAYCEPKPTATPIPTSTRTPIPTATSTPTRTPTRPPTLTPVPPDKPKPDEPCNPITNQSPTVTVLTLPISQVGPKTVASGTFFSSREISIPYNFSGDEKVCLASTADGRGAMVVDDRLDFYVYSNGKLVGQWGHDFYDRATGGIKEFRSEDVSTFFRAGRYEVKLVLADLIPQYYSSTAVYLVIWRP